MLRLFPTLSLTQGDRRVGWPSPESGGPRIVFPISHQSFLTSAFFLAVISRFCCRAAVDRPRAPFLVTMSLHYLIRSGGESELLVGNSVLCPV